jgi:hypothetical protein
MRDNNKNPKSMISYYDLEALSMEEMLQVNKMIIHMIKEKRKDKAFDVRNELCVGMKVSVNHPKLVGKELKVTKINRTKAQLSMLNGFTTYNVPLSLIQIIG